jgi:hypothetical protein
VHIGTNDKYNDDDDDNLLFIYGLNQQPHGQLQRQHKCMERMTTTMTSAAAATTATTTTTNKDQTARTRKRKRKLTKHYNLITNQN